MRRRRSGKEFDIRQGILFLLVILCLYFILSLFGFSITGESGKEWGEYLRTAWGGAVLVPLLFWLYLCVAKILKYAVPNIPRQVLGTLQLYISFAFMLGLLHETGWNSELALFAPGILGTGLAHFFILNLGVFLTLILVVCSFILSAFLFGLKVLRVSLNKIEGQDPKVPETRRRHRARDKADLQYPADSPENILFMKDLPEPLLKSESEEDAVQTFPEIPTPQLKPAPEDYIEEPEPVEDENSNFDDVETENENVSKNLVEPHEEKPQSKGNYAVEIIDSLIASIDAGALSMPEKNQQKQSKISDTAPRNAAKPRRNRRPLPVIMFNDETDGAVINGTDDLTFPPPMEIFGTGTNFAPKEENKTADSNKTSKNIIATLNDFGVEASIADVITGPSVVQYLVELAPGMKAAKVAGLADDLARILALASLRIEAPVPGTRYVGIEIPLKNSDRKKIPLRSIFESDDFKENSSRLPIPLGVQINKKILIKGLENMPHLLVAGSKGSGKSTFINTSILSICSRRKPDELKLILIDPRHVDFNIYNGLPHLLTPIAYDYDAALKSLKWAFDEMENRTGNFASYRVNSLASYNRKLPKKDRLPEIVIIISELSDLMYESMTRNDNELEDLIVRLAQKSGVAGIYMIIASQKPGADVVTTLIRSNISARAAFSLSSATESKNIIGIPDADKLTGRGDMLFKETDTSSPQIFRLQAPYIDEEKISEFVEYLEGIFN